MIVVYEIIRFVSIIFFLVNFYLDYVKKILKFDFIN